jgi:hypothetical protein
MSSADKEIKTLIPGSNGEYVRHLLQIHFAGKIPKAHVPLGIIGFVLTASISTMPGLPFAAAALFAFDAARRLRKNRRLVSAAYADPSVLYMRLKPDEQEVVRNFFSRYPMELPAVRMRPDSQKKDSAPQQKQQQQKGQQQQQQKAAN